MRLLIVLSSWLLLLLLLPRSFRCEGEYQTVYACEGTTLELQCQQSEVIELVRANFGRFSITICNTLGNTNWTVKCMTPNSLRVLQKSCGTGSRCVVPISTDVFGDACPGTTKYIEVQYRCVAASSTSTTKRPLPPWHDLYPDPSIWLQQDSDETERQDTDSSRSSTQSAVSSTTTTTEASRHEDRSTSSVIDASNSIPSDADRLSEPPKVKDLNKSLYNNVDISNEVDSLSSQVEKTNEEIESENHRENSTPSSLLPTPTSEVHRSVWLPKSSSGDEFVYTPPPPSFSLPPSTSSPAPLPYDRSDHNPQKQGERRHQSRLFNEPYHSGRHAQSNDDSATMTPSHCHWTSARGLLWPSTSANSQAILPCPRGATGRARWLCNGSTGRWARPTPDLSDCHSPAVSGLEHELLSGKTGPLGVAARLSEATRVHEQQESVLGGDVRLVARLSGELAAALAAQLVEEHVGGPEHRGQVARQLVTSVLQMTSNLLDARQRAAWYDMSPRERVQTATRLMIGLEQVAFLLSDYMLPDNNIAELADHLYLSVLSARNKGTAQDFVFPLVSPRGEWHNKGNSLRLPSSTNLGEEVPASVKIVFLMYDGLEHILQPESLSDAAVRYVINSGVISASLGEGRHVPVARPVTIVLRHLVDIPSDLADESPGAAYKLSCRYWDYAATSWLADGCWLLESNTTHTTCQCNHLTHFAVLMEVHRSSVETTVMADGEAAVRVVVYVGGAIAVMGMSFAMLALFLATSAGMTAVSCSAGSWHHGGLRLHFSLMKHLLAALLLAELCLFLGLHQTGHSLMCGMLAGCLQFFLLLTLTWHALDQLLVYNQWPPAVAGGGGVGGSVVAGSCSRARCYCAVGYTLPLLVVAVSCAVDASSYGSLRHCWLSLDNYFVLSFVVPAVICVIGSLCLLALNCCLVRQQYETHITMTTVSMATVKQRARSARMTCELGRSFLLLVVLLLFMTTALAYLELKTDTTAYLFAAANTCLGVYLVVMLVVKDPLVRLNLSEGCLQSSSCFHYSTSDNGGSRSGTKVVVAGPIDANGVCSGEVICASSGTINTMLQPHDRANALQLWPANAALGKTGSLRSSTAVPHSGHAATAYSLRRGTVARASNSMVLSSSTATAISAAPTLRNNIALTDVSSIEPGMDSGHGTGSEHEESPHILFGTSGFRSLMNHPVAESRIASATLGGGVSNNHNSSRWSTLHGYRAPTDLVYHPSITAAYHTYVEVDRDPEYEEIGRQMMGHQLLTQPPPPPAPTSSWAHHPENMRRHHMVPTSMHAPLPQQGYSQCQDQNVAVAMLDGENVVCRLQSQ